MMKPTRKNLEKLVHQYSQLVKLDHRVHKGYHVATGQYGWYWVPFGENSRFLGKNITTAIEVIQERLDN